MYHLIHCLISDLTQAFFGWERSQELISPCTPSRSPLTAPSTIPVSHVPSAKLCVQHRISLPEAEGRGAGFGRSGSFAAVVLLPKFHSGRVPHLFPVQYSCSLTQHGSAHLPHAGCHHHTCWLFLTCGIALVPRSLPLFCVFSKHPSSQLPDRDKSQFIACPKDSQCSLRHPGGAFKPITLPGRCKVTMESCTQPSNHMKGFITPGSPLDVKYWINLQQLCWCFLHFGRELSPPRNARGMGYDSH